MNLKGALSSMTLSSIIKAICNFCSCIIADEPAENQNDLIYSINPGIVFISDATPSSDIDIISRSSSIDPYDN
jgi:hypothetical protein